MPFTYLSTFISRRLVSRWNQFMHQFDSENIFHFIGKLKSLLNLLCKQIKKNRTLESFVASYKIYFFSDARRKIERKITFGGLRNIFRVFWSQNFEFSLLPQAISVRNLSQLWFHNQWRRFSRGKIFLEDLWWLWTSRSERSNFMSDETENRKISDESSEAFTVVWRFERNFHVYKSLVSSSRSGSDEFQMLILSLLPNTESNSNTCSMFLAHAPFRDALRQLTIEFSSRNWGYNEKCNAVRPWTLRT